MSQATAARTATRPAGRTPVRAAVPAARLRVIPTPERHRPGAGLWVGCLILLSVGLIGLLVLNVNLEHGAYQLRAGQAEADQLKAEEQNLREQLAALQAPQQLAGRASQLGMVPNPNAAFVNPSGGPVLGVPKQAQAAPVLGRKAHRVSPTARPTAAVGTVAPKPAAPKPAATR